MLDLVICVFGCDTIEKYKAEILKIEETWGAKALSYSSIKVFFFLGEEETNLCGEQYIHLLGVKNDYMSASHKQFLGLKYIHENYPCRFVFVCGTDTYINIPKLVKYIDLFNPQANLYIGGHGTKTFLGGKEIYYHSGGAGFLLSSGCQSALYPLLDEAVKRWTDICIANDADTCLYTACDVAISYFVQLPEVGSFVLKQGDSLFMGCNYCGLAYGYYPCHVNEINIETLITCHSMSLADFDAYTELLKGNGYFITPFHS